MIDFDHWLTQLDDGEEQQEREWHTNQEELLGNDAAIVQMIADLGLSVVDGKLCVTYEEE